LPLSRTDELIAAATTRAGSARPAPGRGPRRSSSSTHFRCGHEKSAENTYGAGPRARCRPCAKETAARWRRENAARKAEYQADYRTKRAKLDHVYRRKHRLAYQLYYLIRRLAIADGLWHARGDSHDRERGAA